MILAENEAGAAPWYQLVYERLTQETPFSFSRVAQLVEPGLLDASCADNRGPDGRAALPRQPLDHHRPAAAARPTRRRSTRATPLLRRARDCERLRGQLPNLLAVDFYRRGDLFGVVDELNGVG